MDFSRKVGPPNVPPPPPSPAEMERARQKRQILEQFAQKIHLTNPQPFLKILASGKVDENVLKSAEVHTAAVHACEELGELIERGGVLPSKGSIFGTIMQFRAVFDLKEVRFNKAQILREFANQTYLSNPKMLFAGLRHGGAEPEALQDAEVHAAAVRACEALHAVADADKELVSGAWIFAVIMDMRDVFSLQEMRFTKQQVLRELNQQMYFKDPVLFLKGLQRESVEPGVVEDDDVKAAVEIALAHLRNFAEVHKLVRPEQEESGVFLEFRELFSLPEARVKLGLIRPRVSVEVWDLLEDVRIPPQARLSYLLKIQEWLKHHPGEVGRDTQIKGLPPIPEAKPVVPDPHAREVGDLYEPPSSPDAGSGVRKSSWKAGRGVEVARGTLDVPDDPDSERVEAFDRNVLRAQIRADATAVNDSVDARGIGLFDRQKVQEAMEGEAALNAMDTLRRRQRLLEVTGRINKRRQQQPPKSP